LSKTLPPLSIELKILQFGVVGNEILKGRTLFESRF
jgi:hypothetical protein